MLQNINLNGASVSAELHAIMYDYLYGYNGVFAYGRKLAYEIVTNNEIKLYDGMICNQGRFMQIVTGSYETILIENGTSGTNRTDLIVAHFETDGITEIHDIRVLKGTTEYTTGNVHNGDTVNEMPLYEVKLEGLNIVSVKPLFETICSIDDIRKNIGKSNLLINGYFGKAVNGRGSTSYTSSGSAKYTVDRWFITGTGRTVSVGGGVLTLTSTNESCYINQIIEGLNIDNNTYTLSAKINSKVREFTFVHDGTSKSKTFEDGTSLIAEMGGSNELSVAVGYATGTSATVEWVKLEIGSIATPFIPNRYEEEMDKCKRYYDEESIYMSMLYSFSTTKFKFGGTYLKQKRATPTLTLVNGFAYDSSNSQTSVSACEFKGTTSEGFMADVTFAKAVDDGASGCRLTIRIDAEIY